MVFGDWALKYFEAGYSVTPVKAETKNPFLKDWQAACENQTIEEIEKLSYAYPGSNIGLCCGPFSNIIGVDFDYTLPDCEHVEQLVIACLPPRLVMKKGKKGWTAFYRYNSDIPCLPINKKYEGQEDRLIDLIGKGRQTVMPPSIHPETKKPYIWTTPDTLFDIRASELPEFTEKHRLALIEITKLKSDSDYRELSVGRHKRHDAVFSHVMREIYSYESIEQMVSDMISFDLKHHAGHEKGPYFSDTTYLNGKSKTDFVSSLAKRIVSWKKRRDSENGISWDIGTNKSSIEYQASAKFFREQMPDATKCILTKKVQCKVDGFWTDVTSRIKPLRSWARDTGIKHTRVEDDLSRWCEGLKPELLYRFSVWDGKDHIFEASKRLDSPEFSSQEISDILKNFGVNCLRRLDSENNQNRCPIFKGPQEIGKDYFVRSLFGGFEPYYRAVTPPDSTKDFLEIVSRLLICHIEEFDQTAKVNVAFLKSLITQPNQYFRESYGTAPNTKMTRPSFISTANVDNLLRDPTGNRRFILIPLTGIVRTNSRPDSHQVMAQIHSLYLNGEYRLQPETEAKISEIIQRYSPDSPDLSIIELWEARAAEKSPMGELLPSVSAEVILGIARETRRSEQAVRQVLNANGYKKKSNGVRIYTSRREKS